MWNSVQVSVGSAVHRGRYRMEGDQVVLEWRQGRVAERCGFVRPEVVAAERLRKLVTTGALAA